MTWLLLFELLGNAIAETLAMPVPGAVIGMMLLFVALIARGGVPDDLRDTGNLLLQNLMLLLVPATAGLVVEFPRLREEGLPICVAVIGGAAITIGVTAVTLRFLIPARSGTP